MQHLLYFLLARLVPKTKRKKQIIDCINKTTINATTKKNRRCHS